MVLILRWEKGIQANPVVYNGLVYVPTPGNHIVCLDGASGGVNLEI